MAERTMIFSYFPKFFLMLSDGVIILMMYLTFWSDFDSEEMSSKCHSNKGSKKFRVFINPASGSGQALSSKTRDV